MPYFFNAMKNTFFLLFFVVSYTVFGQKTIFKNYQSEYLKGIRDLSIYLPKSYDKDSITNFPLTVVLDGQILFDLVIGNSNYYAMTDKAPEQIIVGVDIEKTRRTDLSFDENTSKLTESGEKFYLFIKEELLPFIEANYKTSPFLTIIGTGISGNYLTHFLREKTPIFNAYVNINPTLAPETSKLIADFNLKRLSLIDNTYYYYLSTSSFNTGENATFVDNLNRSLNTVGVSNFNFVFNEFKNSPTITSATAESIPRALDKVFELYSGISKDEFETKIKNLDPPSAIAYLETKYLDIEYLFGTNMGIRQRDIIAIEGIIIDKENGDYLEDFGKMILKVFPTSQMGHFYLGTYYEKEESYMKALEQFRIGYGKMDPSDPNADKFYMNIERVLRKL